MGEVENLHHAKDQREADRDEREDAAEQKAADDGLSENDRIHEHALADESALER